MSGISTSAFQSFAGLGGAQDYAQALVPLGSIDPHPDNRPIIPEKVEKLAATIERDGLGQLPLVRAMPNGRYQMISGHHRLEAYKLLFARTGDAKWKLIPVSVIRNCDDARALCLLHMTNIVASDLTKEEVGRAYEALAAVIKEERAKDPEALRGMHTNRIIAQISAEQGRPAGITYVKEARRAYRESTAANASPRKRPAPARPSEADMAADALQRAIERLEVLGAEELKRVAPRLPRYARRLRALARECGK